MIFSDFVVLVSTFMMLVSFTLYNTSRFCSGVLMLLAIAFLALSSIVILAKFLGVSF